MNRIFRTLWSHSLQAWVVTSELAKACGKRGSGRAVGLLLLTPLGAGAADLPSGGTVVSGSGHLSSTGQQLTVDQTSPNLAIDWQSFDIGAGYGVTFHQPSSQAVALNRVVGQDASRILGNLDANGRVFLVNPNGILFGQGASVNVGGLVASTLDISNSDFEQGRYHFKSQTPPKAVINQGSLTAKNGGAVALLGGQVSNQGVIVANGGSVALAAGQAMTLDFAGDGLLSVKVDEATADALAENRELIRANGGQVLLTAHASDALLKTVVNNSGVIEAQTLAERGGKIELLGGFNGGTVQVAGTLDASAPQGGNGGFIETSGAHVQVADGAHITTKAPQGQSGTWLLDPTDFTVSAGSGAQSSSGIGASTLAANLQNGNVTLQTVSSGSDSGNINVNSAVSWSANTTLTLSAHGDLYLNAPITAQAASGKVALKYGQASSDGGTADYHLAAPINLQSGQNFSTQKGSAGSVTLYTVVNDAATLQAMNNNLSGNYAVGSNLDLSSIANWKPLGKQSMSSEDIFTGQFAGLGHTLSNLNIDRSSESFVGLFGYTSGSLIRDIGLLGGSVKGDSYVGGLVGSNSGTIKNTYATGTVSGAGSYVGGLVGSNSYASTISNAYATGSVSGAGNNVGGLVGSNSGGTISNAYATGKVSGTAMSVGGLVGYNSGDISNAYATGSVSSTDGYVGGLVGGNFSTISNAYATGSVSGASSVGGLVGNNTFGGTISNAYATGSVSSTDGYVGGLVGYSYGSTISNAYATGSVSGTGDSVGGLVGSSRSDISNAYATGSVSGTGDFVGGLVGSSGGTISNAYATGSVTGTDFVGGLVGKNYGTIKNTYATGSVLVTSSSSLNGGGLVGANDSESETTITDSFYATTKADGTAINNAGATSGSFAGNGIGTGKTWAELTQASTFSGWNIATTGGSNAVWRLYAGSSTPLLRSFLTPLTVTASVANNKVYDGSASNGTAYTTSVPGATLLGSLTYRTRSANVGTYSVQDGSLTLSDQLYSTQLGYDISTATTASSLSITPKTLTGSITAENKTYDGTTAATTHGTLDGVIASDNVTFATSGSFVDKNVGTGKTVNTSGSLGGSAAGNYELAANATTTANIAAKSITGSITAENKTYDGTTAATTSGTLDGVIAGDNVTLATSGSFADKNAGNGKTVNTSGSLGGSAAGNYELAANATTTANITPASLVITAQGASKTAGQLAQLSDYSVTGLFTGDAVTQVALASPGADASAAPGSYLIVPSAASGLGLGNYLIDYRTGTLTVQGGATTQPVPGGTTTQPLPGRSAISAVSASPVLAAQVSSAIPVLGGEADIAQAVGDLALRLSPLDVSRGNNLSALPPSLDVINRGIRLPEGI